MSVALDEPTPEIISGDKYAGEPQKLYAMKSGSSNYLDNPKSVNLMYPLWSNNIFSGFKSL